MLVLFLLSWSHALPTLMSSLLDTSTLHYCYYPLEWNDGRPVRQICCTGYIMPIERLFLRLDKLNGNRHIFYATTKQARKIHSTLQRYLWNFTPRLTKKQVQARNFSLLPKRERNNLIDRYGNRLLYRSYNIVYNTIFVLVVPSIQSAASTVIMPKK